MGGGSVNFQRVLESMGELGSFLAVATDDFWLSNERNAKAHTMRRKSMTVCSRSLRKQVPMSAIAILA